MSVKVRSIAGMFPTLAVAVIDEEILHRPHGMGTQLAAFLHRGRDTRDKLQQLGVLRGDPGQQRLLLSVADMDRLVRLFARLFDEREFLSPYGLRTMSSYHRDHA